MRFASPIFLSAAVSMLIPCAAFAQDVPQTSEKPSLDSAYTRARDCITPHLIADEPSGEPATVIVDVAMGFCDLQIKGIWTALIATSQSKEMRQGTIDAGPGETLRIYRLSALETVMQMRAKRLAENRSDTR